MIGYARGTAWGRGSDETAPDSGPPSWLSELLGPICGYTGQVALYLKSGLLYSKIGKPRATSGWTSILNDILQPEADENDIAD